MSRHATTRALLRAAADRAADHLLDLETRGVAPTPDAVAAIEAFRRPLPRAGDDPAELLDHLARLGSPAAMGTAGPRFFGFVIGGVTPAALAAHILAAGWDQNSGLAVAAPLDALLEEVVLGWVVDLLELPAGTGGGFVTGATMANFTCLAAARRAVLARHGVDVERKGLFGAPPVTVVVGEEAHPGVTMPLGYLGLGRERVVTVPADEQGRMRADALPDPPDGPIIVCAQAGNVNSGAVDPLGAICDWAAGCGAWVHVDGAFGIWARVAPSRRHLVDDVERADSWATDAHKWLNTPYDGGLALVRDPGVLRGAMTAETPYLTTDERRQPSHWVPELSRRARAIEIWAALRALGRDGLVELIERCCRHARRFGHELTAGGLEVLNEVVLNQVVVAFGSEERTGRVVAAIQSDGTLWAGPTRWRGRAAMRLSVSSWATDDDDVTRSVAAILTAARRAG